MRRQTKPNRNEKWAPSAAGLFSIAGVKTLLQFLRLGKKSGALLSMAVATAIYMWFYQWEFALGVTLMVLVHELGHVAAARHKGIPVTAPFFIPFLGALIMLKRNPRDAETEAFVALGGPLLGTLGAFVSFLIGLATGEPLFYAIAYIGFTLNLINLLPIHPLDGGRIASSVTRWLWVAGALGGLVAVIFLHSILFFLLWALFVWDLISKYIVHRGKTTEYSFWGKIEVPFEQIPGENWMLIPFREREPLPYRTYSDLDGKQWVEIEWEEADVVHLIKMQEQGIIRSVVSTKVERRWRQTPKVVVLRYQIDYEPHEIENYYEVPDKIRWKFGISYGALALVLFVMLDIVQMMLNAQGGFLHSLRK
ncbi:site-2 protease family protein [Paenibacillus hemerocallicola]|uniref:Site-2 protease family protein n=1 Tax=Paenibacillus hemerocallicola TaxID=1172614 RepID=A0A5C4T281_9BACL|nr:site-2 protease family protein [Paenibacillus hemerocallicola]TNJ63161.1 site-2 protease family protein [Paenibacillus hemerocallicola]